MDDQKESFLGPTAGRKQYERMQGQEKRKLESRDDEALPLSKRQKEKQWPSNEYEPSHGQRPSQGQEPPHVRAPNLRVAEGTTGKLKAELKAMERHHRQAQIRAQYTTYYDMPDKVRLIGWADVCDSRQGIHG